MAGTQLKMDKHLIIVYVLGQGEPLTRRSSNADQVK